MKQQNVHDFKAQRDLTRALERGLRITPSRGGGRGAYNASPNDLGSYESCRDKFWGVSGAALEPFLAKIWRPWVNPSMVKKSRIKKC